MAMVQARCTSERHMQQQQQEEEEEEEEQADAETAGETGGTVQLHDIGGRGRRNMAQQPAITCAHSPRTSTW